MRLGAYVSPSLHLSAKRAEGKILGLEERYIVAQFFCEPICGLSSPFLYYCVVVVVLVLLPLLLVVVVLTEVEVVFGTRH